MKNKTIRNVTYLAMLVMGAVMFSQSAFALDRKVLSGSSCQPNTGSQVSDFSYYSTGIQNNSTASRWVTCSGVRDNTFNTNGVNFARVHVAGTGSFSCYLDNVNNNGTLGRWAFGSRTNSGIIVTNLTSSVSQTPYAFLCRLPAGGKLVTTIIDEK